MQTWTETTRNWPGSKRFHRLDGPAMIHETGELSWWVHGTKVISFEEFQRESGLPDAEILMLKLKWGGAWEWDTPRA